MLSGKLTEDEIKQLEKYRFCCGKPAGDSILFSALADREQLPRVLNGLRIKIGAPNTRVAASILIKRLAFYAVIHLYAMTALKKRLLVDRRQLRLVENRESDLWLPELFFGDFYVQEAGKDFRNDILGDLFSNGLSPILNEIRKSSRLSEAVIWENIAVYIRWIYNEMLSKGDLRKRAAEDLHYIFHADGNIFGLRKNPLAPFLAAPNNERQTCCLSFSLKGIGKKKCSTCPLMKAKPSK